MDAETLVPSKMFDRDLETRIRTFLATRSMPGLRSLDVSVDGGRVVIAGRVQTFYEKQVATSCCQRVAGVLEVLNEVDVVPKDDIRRPLISRENAGRARHVARAK